MIEEALEQMNVKLEAVAIELDKEQKKIDVRKIFGLTQTAITVRKIRTEIELYSLFPVKPVSGVAMYRYARNSHQH